MSVSGISALGASTAFDFTQITPTQVQQAAFELGNNGTLSASEASVLSGLGSASSFSPIDGDSTSLSSGSDTGWQSINLNVLSDLQNEISVGKKENLGPEGSQLLATDQSLLQKLAAYQASSYDTSSSIGSVLNTNA